MNVDYVFARLAGELVAFEDLCPHGLAPLSGGICTKDTIKCAYHGWEFDSHGSCVKVPGLGKVSARDKAQLVGVHAIKELFGVIFVAIKPTLTSLLDIPEAKTSEFLEGSLTPIEIQGSAGLLLDNFLDLVHSPFVHKEDFGDFCDVASPTLDIRKDIYEFTATYEYYLQNQEDAGVHRGLNPIHQRRKLTYRYSAPFSLLLEIDHLDDQVRNVIGVFLSPQSRDRVRVLSKFWRNDIKGKRAMNNVMKLEESLIRKNLIVQSTLRTLGLSLNPDSQLHAKTDRLTWLLCQVLTDFLASSARIDSENLNYLGTQIP